MMQAETQSSEMNNEKAAKSMFELDVDCVRKKQAELLEMYPSHRQRILSAVSNVGKIKGVKPERIKKLLQADKMLEQYATRATNISFEEQQDIRKVLVESAGGEQSDYESEAEGELTTIEDNDDQANRKSRQEIKLEKKQSRIFKHLSVIDRTISLPAQKSAIKDKELGPITLFLEIDDVFLHTFLCDENFGYMANPSEKDHNHEFLIEEWKQPVLVYERDHMRDFLDYLKGVKPEVETILYTTGQKVYTDKLLKIVDPTREIFDHVLY